MWQIYGKEITGFFSSLTGYVVMVVFLTLNSLFMWVFPGQMNVLDIVFAKFLASWSLVVLSLVPTLVFFWSVYQLGSPPGNIDLGGTWGSYIGLVFLGGIYAAIGVFASAVTDNQIVAIIAGVLLCFMVYLGFDFVGGLAGSGYLNLLIARLGIDHHYNSISRGVLDSRDLFYFIGVIVLFLMSTRLVLQKSKW